MAAFLARKNGGKYKKKAFFHIITICFKVSVVNLELESKSAL